MTDHPDVAPEDAARGAGRRTKGKSMYARAASGASWTSVGALTEEALSLLATLILARLVSPAEFGVFGLAATLLGLTVLFSDMAMSQALVRQKDLRPQHVTVALTLCVGLAVFAGALLVLLSAPIANYFKAPQLTQMLWVVAALIPLNAAGSISMALLQRRTAFRLVAVSGLPGMLIGNVLVAVSLAYAGYGAWAVMIGAATHQTITTVIRFSFARHNLMLGWDASAFRDLFSFSAAQTFTRWINYFARNGDNFVVGRMLGMESLGLYTRAYRLLMIPVELASRGGDRVMIPLMAEIQSDPQRMARGYATSVRLYISLLVPLSAFLVISADPIVRIMFGEDWVAMIPVAEVLFASLPLRSAYKQITVPMLVLGRTGRLLMMNAVYASLVVGGSILACLLARDIVAVGAAVALAILTFYLLCAASTNRLLGLPWSRFAALHLPGLTVGAVLTGALLAVQAAMPDAANPFVKLAANGVVAAAVLAPAYLLGGKAVFGPEVHGLLQGLIGKLTRRFRPRPAR